MSCCLTKRPRSIVDFLLILLASGFFIFWGLGSLDLLDPDQGMWGAIAQEMVQGGDWITPHFNGVRHLEKPPLYFWLTALTLSLFGSSERVVRVGSALPALATAIGGCFLLRALQSSRAL